MFLTLGGTNWGGGVHLASVSSVWWIGRFQFSVLVVLICLCLRISHVVINMYNLNIYGMHTLCAYTHMYMDMYIR